MSATTLTLTDNQTLSASPKPSKQLNYYYNHKTERLAYQRDYYNKHHDMILSNQHYRHYLLTVKRVQNNNTVLRIMSIKFYSALRDQISYDRNNLLCQKRFNDAFFHRHGRPNLKRRNSRYAITESKFWFHVIPAIPRARELTVQQAHFLGLKLGDSIIWREQNHYTGRVETHTVCFDRSGLDISHASNLPCLVACAIETGLRGLNLLSAFALRNSVNGYIQVFRGNKLLLTSEPDKPSVLRDYLKVAC